jgi:hypothetical protein
MAKKKNQKLDPLYNRPPVVGVPGGGKPFPRPGRPGAKPKPANPVVSKPIAPKPIVPKPIAPTPVAPKPVAPKPPVKQQQPPKPSTAPKSGFRWHFKNGKWQQVKKLDYISNEIENQIAQAQRVSDYQQKFAKSVYDQMASDAQRLAAAYQPTQFTGPEALSGNRWADLYARTGGAAAAAQNLATLQSVGASRANLGRQQLEYARYLRSQKPYLQQQYQSELDKQRLSQLQADIAAQYKQGQLNLGYDKLASQERVAAAKITTANQRAQASATARFTSDQQKQLASLRKELFKTTVFKKPDGTPDTRWVAPRQPFRTSMERIMELGYRPVDAARIAAQWASASDKQAGKPITFKPNAAYGLYKAMVNRGVRPRYAESIVRQYYSGFSAKASAAQRKKMADLMKAAANAAHGR